MSDMQEEAINYQKLRVKGYDLEYIKELKINSIVNEHAVLNFTGILKNELKDEDIYKTTENKMVEVFYDEDTKKTIFYGVVTNVEIAVNEDVYLLKVEAKSMSYLMDIKIKSRTFQDKSMAIQNIVDYIMKDYSNYNYEFNINDEPSGELLVQYEETDWEFIKRIASKYNAGLFSNMDKNNINFKFGLYSKEESEKCSILQNEMYKSLDEYDYMKQNFLQDANETDYLTCNIKTYDVLNIGKCINLMGQNFYIYEGEYEIVDSILVNRYKLRVENGIRQKRNYNTKIVGTSINGKIINVKNDVVQIHFDIDDKYSGKSDVYWFRFSTISASTDGSGWYYMPEVNDAVMAYFPTKDEDECFAISAVSKYKQGLGEAQDRMGDPDNKYLRTPSDKEVRLTNDGVYILCNSGQGQIEFTNDGNLNISSANDINIVAEENINMNAKNDFKITAENEITIGSNKGGIYNINESGEVTQSGAQLKNN